MKKKIDVMRLLDDIFFFVLMDGWVFFFLLRFLTGDYIWIGWGNIWIGWGKVKKMQEISLILSLHFMIYIQKYKRLFRTGERGNGVVDTKIMSYPCNLL